MSLLGRIFGNTVALELKGFTDWHSHILPGVDDGVKTTDDSIAILSRMEQAGVREVWLTPHIMEDIANTTVSLRERFDSLMKVYGGGILLHLAAENMIDSLFEERLKAGDMLPIGKNRDMLLVETSYFNAPMGLHDTFEKIKSAGYHPLMAHPERYTYVDDIGEYSAWKEMGVRLQLNILSLAGHYGPEARHKAEELLKKDMYDFVGTDLHHKSQLGRLQQMRLSKNMLTHLNCLIGK